MGYEEDPFLTFMPTLMQEDFLNRSLNCLSITTSSVKMRRRFENEKWYVWPLEKEARLLGSRTQENS